MPRQTQADAESSRSASRTPTDASGEPLPAPQTLLSHVLGSRITRAASRSSQASRSNSTSVHASRSSSQLCILGAADSSHPELDDAHNAQAGPSNSNGDALHSSTQPAPALRRRAYSIRDEIDDDGQPFIPSSSIEPEGYSSPEMSPPAGRPPSKRKKQAAPNKRAGRRRKLNNTQALSVPAESEAGPSTLTSTTSQITSSSMDVEIIHLPGEVDTTNGIARVEESSPTIIAKATTSAPIAKMSFEPLAEYTCPICFSAPMNATMTPCGHVCCGECLFTAVRSTLQRAPAPVREPNVARCPVCRAVINGWDGRGGGVIGLKPRTIISL